MEKCLFQITYLVDDYDRAIDFFVNSLGFKLKEDNKINEAKRWVVIDCGGINLLLAKANGETQIQAIGNQFGGRVGFFIECQNFEETYSYLQSKNINFLEAPRIEAYGKVAVFVDIYGHKWDLIGQ
jgi:catechol 2,3-dioxygenase-like lactoylglutathione lyase family enzyme